MQTYSHFIFTAGLSKHLRCRGLHVRAWPFLIGSVLPDLPLIFFSGFYFLYMKATAGWNTGRIFSQLYDHLFFENPFLIFAHNFFHAPLILIAVLFACRYGLKKGKDLLSLYWLTLACLFHAIVDVFTHYNDGPLLFFPFNWSYRFLSPISYWDKSHYGFWVGIAEHLLDVLILLAMWWKHEKCKGCPAVESCQL